MIPEGNLKNTVFFAGKYYNHPIYSLSYMHYINK